MNKNRLLKFGSLILLPALLQCTAAKRGSTGNNNAKVIFFDDFSGSQLDTTKWNVLVTGQVFNNEQQAYVDSALTIYTVRGAAAEGASNGALVLHPRYAPGFVTGDGKKFDFISGRIHTKDKVDFTYGTAAARIKMSEGMGLWPAWWLLGNGRWPRRNRYYGICGSERMDQCRRARPGLLWQHAFYQKRFFIYAKPHYQLACVRRGLDAGQPGV